MFGRDSPFLRGSQTAYYAGGPRHAPVQSIFQRGSRIIDNPFEKSYEHVFNQNQSSHRSLGHYSGDSGLGLPLSKYENRLRLRELDTEAWRREKQREQQQKLDKFGAEALRYSNFTASQAVQPQRAYSSPKSNYSSHVTTIGTQKSVNKLNYATASSEYMVHENKRDHRKFNEDSTAASNLRKNVEKFEDFQQHEAQDRENSGFSQYNDSPHFNRYASNQYGKEQPRRSNQLTKMPSRQFGAALPGMEKQISIKTFGESGYRAHAKQAQVDAEPMEIPGNTLAMSYASNFDHKQKPISYDSDLANQEQNGWANRGPLNMHRFSSSSFDSEMASTLRRDAREPRLSQFARKAENRVPDYISYEGKEYYRVDIFN